MNKQTKWFSILSGVFSVIAGLYMLIHPAASLSSLTLFFAIIFLINGITETINYFSKDSEKSGWTLFHGIITVLLAMSLLTGSFIDVVVFIPYIFAIWVLFSAITKVTLGSKIRKLDKKVGNTILVLGILGLISAIIMLSHPFMTGFFVAYMIGFIFLYNGVSSVFLAFRNKSE